MAFSSPTYFDPIPYLSHNGTDIATTIGTANATNADTNVVMYGWRCPHCTHTNRTSEFEVVCCRNCGNAFKFSEVVTAVQSEDYDKRSARQASKDAEEFIHLAERFGIE